MKPSAKKTIHTFLSLGSHEIRNVVALIADNLRKSPKSFVWLIGDLGAGKTFLVGEILRELGLNKNIPVQSPTFSYVNCYDFDDFRIAHFDLYRLTAACDLEELSGLNLDEFRTVFIEWPKGLLLDQSVTPSIEIQISYSSDSLTRDYIISISEESFV